MARPGSLSPSTRSRSESARRCVAVGSTGSCQPPVLRVGAVAYAGLPLGRRARARRRRYGRPRDDRGARGLIHPPIGSTVRSLARIAPGVSGRRRTRSRPRCRRRSCSSAAARGRLAASSPPFAVAGAGLAILLHDRAITSAARPRGAAVTHRGRGASERSVRRASHRRPYAAVVGVAFGSVELAMPAFAEQEVSRELGGIGLACFPAGSLVGGLLAGIARRATTSAASSAARWHLPSRCSGSSSQSRCPRSRPLAFVAGLPIAPTVAALYSSDRPHGTHRNRGRGVCVYGPAVSIGFAAGAAAAGALVEERGVRWAFGSAGCRPRRCPLGWLRRSTLHRRATVYPHGSARSQGDRAADF